MEIEKRFAMTKACQDISLYVNDIQKSVCGFESQSLIITVVAISILFHRALQSIFWLADEKERILQIFYCLYDTGRAAQKDSTFPSPRC